MIENYIIIVGDWISYTGVLIVILGVFVTLFKLLHYVFTGLNDENTARLRHSLMIYLSLGLDFLIAKDVIITLSLEQGDVNNFLTLGLVILIRMMLSIFVHLEDKELHIISMRSKKKPKKKKIVKSKT
ncbi:MAG: putative membrane protein [Oceanicoccus sp.]|jgi:uncharacterized membrane protein